MRTKQIFFDSVADTLLRYRRVGESDEQRVDSLPGNGWCVKLGLNDERLGDLSMTLSFFDSTGLNLFFLREREIAGEENTIEGLETFLAIGREDNDQQ